MSQFSVIVPVYNAAATLESCVASIAAQPGPRDWECILVDDGSTDGSGALCDALAEKYPGIRVLHTPNGGPGAARNAGMEAAEGTWLLFLDSDDRWPGSMLPGLRQSLARWPEADWYIGRYANRNGEGNLSLPAQSWPADGLMTGGSYAERLAALTATGSQAVWKFCLRREAVQRSGVRFDPAIRWAEDLLFSLQLLAHPLRLCAVPNLLVEYTNDRAGSLANSGLVKHIQDVAAIWQRLQPLRETLPPDGRAALAARIADVFWPDCRALAGADAAARRECLPAVASLRPLYGAGSQCRGRTDWVLYRWLLTLFGARFGLWAAGLLKR